VGDGTGAGWFLLTLMIVTVSMSVPGNLPARYWLLDQAWLNAVGEFYRGW